MQTQQWVKSFHVGRMQFRLTLMRHTYKPGDRRWVLQTSSYLDLNQRITALVMEWYTQQT